MVLLVLGAEKFLVLICWCWLFRGNYISDFFFLQIAAIFAQLYELELLTLCFWEVWCLVVALPSLHRLDRLSPWRVMLVLEKGLKENPSL